MKRSKHGLCCARGVLKRLLWLFSVLTPSAKVTVTYTLELSLRCFDVVDFACRQ